VLCVYTDRFMASGSGLTIAGRGQSTTAPYVGSNSRSNSLFSRPTPQTQTIGWMSNETIPYHWTIARWTNNIDKSIMNGQIVFLKCDNGTPLLKNKAYTMMNLPMCNYALYRDAIEQQKADALLPEDSVQRSASEMTLASILKTYRPMGSVINDVNGDSDASNNADRVVNVCISGRQTTFNIWGDIHDGDYLYLKLEKCEVKGTDFNLTIKQYNKTQDEQHTMHCYQWVPCKASSICRWRAQSTNPKQKFPSRCVEIGRVFRCPRGKDYDLAHKDKLHFVHNLSDMVSKTYLFEIHWNILP